MARLGGHAGSNPDTAAWPSAGATRTTGPADGGIDTHAAAQRAGGKSRVVSFRRLNRFVNVMLVMASSKSTTWASV